MMIWWLVACTPPPGERPDGGELDVTGFDGGELSSEGLWVQQDLLRNGVVVETLHGFFLTSSVPGCDAVRTAEDPAVAEAANTAITDRASCEAVRAAWRIRGAHPLARTGLAIDLSLWSAEGDGGPGVAPAAGVVEPLDGPDGDPVEYAFHASRVHGNWPLQVAERLDCDAAEVGGDPWADVPGDDTDRDFAASGPITFDAPTDAYVDVALDLDVVGNGAPGGTIQGHARLHACRTSRTLESGTPAGH